MRSTYSFLCFGSFGWLKQEKCYEVQIMHVTCNYNHTCLWKEPISNWFSLGTYPGSTKHFTSQYFYWGYIFLKYLLQFDISHITYNVLRDNFNYPAIKPLKFAEWKWKTHWQSHVTKHFTLPLILHPSLFVISVFDLGKPPKSITGWSPVKQK